MLTWIAAATSRIRVATRVLGMPYRPPAMVAKMAETLDRLSGGRLILGLGGGHSDDEFRAFGLGVPSPRDKVDGMADGIEIIRGLWSEPAFSYAGRIHHTDRADLEPKPAHPIPVWLGTYGPRALAATGRLADGWIPSYGFAPPERIPAMRDRILAAAESAGRDPAALTLAYNITVHVGGEARPGVLTGSPAAIAEQLLDFRDKLGFNAFNLSPAGPAPLEQAAALAHEVLPIIGPF